MSGRYLKMADETEIDSGEAGYNQGFLWCYFTGYTLPEAAAIFFDHEKTNVIEFHYGEMVDTYNGFTDCVNLGVDVDGKVSVCMKKGAASVV